MDASACRISPASTRSRCVGCLPGGVSGGWRVAASRPRTTASPSARGSRLPPWRSWWGLGRRKELLQQVGAVLRLGASFLRILDLALVSPDDPGLVCRWRIAGFQTGHRLATHSDLQVVALNRLFERGDRFSRPRALGSHVAEKQRRLALTKIHLQGFLELALRALEAHEPPVDQARQQIDGRRDQQAPRAIDVSASLRITRQLELVPGAPVERPSEEPAAPVD